MKKFNQFLAGFLCFAMILGSFTTNTFIVSAAESKTEVVKTISTKESILAPGVVHTDNVAYAADGGMIHYYVSKADMTRDDLIIQTSYYNAQCSEWGLQKMTDQVGALIEKHTNPDDAENYIENYAPVVGIDMSPWNTSTNIPSGAFVMNGYMLRETAEGRAWFAVFPDGAILCGSGNADYAAAIAEHGTPEQALGGFQLLLNKGVRVEPGTLEAGDNKPNYTAKGSRYPSAFVGVTAEGEVVFICVDGKGMGGSVGADYYEAVTILEEQGCIYAMSCDGGGSATYVYRPEGEKDVILGNKPADGAEREVATGMVISTTTPPSDVFDRATFSVEEQYVTPNSSVIIEATGVSPAGTPAEIPSDVTWTLSDDSYGTVEDGVFISNGKVGTVAVRMEYAAEIVGEIDIHVVNPANISFDQPTLVIPYGKYVNFVMDAIYVDPEGVNREVAVKPSDFDFSFSDNHAGTLDGFMFTATEDESIKAVTVTAKYKHVELDDFSVDITFGKASEVVWDFEDGDISNWLGLDDALAWSKENAPGNALNTELSGSSTDISGQIVKEVDSTTFLATEENGHVKNGKYALGVEFNNTYDPGFGGWVYNMFFNVEGQTVLRDVANGKNATTLGMWVYLPEGIAEKTYAGEEGFAMQLQVYTGTSSENAGTAGLKIAEAHMILGNMTNADSSKNILNNATSADIPEAGWVYCTFDLTRWDYVSLQDPTANTWREPCFMRFYTKRFEPKKYVFYFDDIALDYSSAIDDREAPIISNLTYTSSTVFDNTSFTTVCPDNKVSLFANIADKAASNASGLDYSSAKIYVDGVALSGVSASGTTIKTDNAVTLTGGIHTVTYEIADNMGTVTKESATLTISNGNTPVSLGGHNDLNNVPEYDSIYYVDIKATDIAAVSSVVTQIKLNTANTWELEHMIAAEGFEARYSIDKYSNIATITVTKVGDCSLTGTQTLVSLPVRVWSWNEEASGIPTATQAVSTSRPIVAIRCNIVSGVVDFVDGNYDEYLGTFGDSIVVDTMIQDEKNAWHFHTTKSLDDVSASCTTDGYAGRTYCDVCGSVVAWGETIEAFGHEYTLIDNVLKCTCNETFTGVWNDGKEYVNGIVIADGWNGDSYYVNGVKLTGIQVVDGFYYNFGEDGICSGKNMFSGLFYDESVSAYRYAKLGELAGGWIMIDDNWHFFDRTEKVAVTGDYYYSGRGVTYHFDETGMTKGVWQITSAGTRYWYGPSYYAAKNQFQRIFVEIDGKTYNFDVDGYLTTGIHALYNDWGATIRGEMNVWEFDENGVLQGQITTLGLIDDKRGGMYLVEEDGYVHGGNARLVEYNGCIYFVNHSGRLKVNGKAGITASNSNGLLPSGIYYFGEDGKLFTGVKKDEDGNLYYYKDGKLGKNIYNSELAEINGTIYLVKWSGKVATNENRAITAKISNGLLPSGIYYFGEDGKLFTGVKKDGDGNLYYYKDGKLGKNIYNSELAEINETIYLVKWSGKVAANEDRVIGSSNSNSLLPSGTYHFGEDGKLFTGVKEGEDGNLYYYKSGKFGNHIYNSELAEINGTIYLVKWSGKVAANEDRVIGSSNSNSLLASGIYYFGEDGKLFTGVKECEDGNWYYYKDGKLFTGVKEDEDGNWYYYKDGKIGRGVHNSKLAEINGAIYLVKWSGKVATNEDRIIYSAFSNGLLPTGTYYFGEDGKLLTGVKEGEDGNLYYYKDGKLGKNIYNSELVEINGTIYFVKWSGKIAKNEERVITASNSNGLLASGTYYFGEDAKLQTQ